jgi:hypothetical protein
MRPSGSGQFAFFEMSPSVRCQVQHFFGVCKNFVGICYTFFDIPLLTRRYFMQPESARQSRRELLHAKLDALIDKCVSIC